MTTGTTCRFLEESRAILDRCLSESMAAVVAGAWEAAGRPPVTLDAQSPPWRRRRE
jgi:hypothetical protein